MSPVVVHSAHPVTFCCVKPVLNVLVLAAAAAVAVALVATRRPSRPNPKQGSWQPMDHRPS